MQEKVSDVIKALIEEHFEYIEFSDDKVFLIMNDGSILALPCLAICFFESFDNRQAYYKEHAYTGVK
jgi:hypothetical protein